MSQSLKKKKTKNQRPSQLDQSSYKFWSKLPIREWIIFSAFQAWANRGKLKLRFYKINLSQKTSSLNYIFLKKLNVKRTPRSLLFILCLEGTSKVSPNLGRKCQIVLNDEFYVQNVRRPEAGQPLTWTEDRKPGDNLFLGAWNSNENSSPWFHDAFPIGLENLSRTPAK